MINFKKFFKNIFFMFKFHYRNYQNKKGIIFDFIKIKPKSQMVVLKVKHKNIILNFHLEQAVKNNGIIEGMQSDEACQLGFEYGKILATTQKNIEHNFSQVLRLKNLRGRYQMVYQNRKKQINYIDKITQKSFFAFPLTLANNRSLISQFDPTQACYIGIWAGSAEAKIKSSAMCLKMPAS